MGKTGTSSIQDLLRRNRTRLADAGILYPRAPGRARHVRFGLLFQPDNRLRRLPAWHSMGIDSPARFRQRFQRKLMREIERAALPRVLFSDEALYGLPEQGLRGVAEFAAQYDGSLRVVVYLRRQDDHLVSHYQQVVKVGETRRLVERIQQADYSNIHDYYARLRSWGQQAQPDGLVVRRFEPDQFAGGSLHQDFFEAAEIRGLECGFEQLPSRNQSLGAEAVEFLRILNLLRKQDPSAAALTAGNHDIIGRLGLLDDGPSLTAPGALLDEVMSRWSASNAAVAHEFIQDGESLFRKPRKTRNTTTEQYFDPDRLDDYVTLLELPEQVTKPLRTLVEREARGG